MKKYLFTFIILLTGWAAFGQLQIRKSSLAPVGTTASQSGMNIITAGGELANREAGVGATHLSEGFIGPDLAAIMGVEEYTTLSGVELFPNPMDRELHIRTAENKTYEVYVHDLSGRQVMHFRFTGDQISVNVSRLQAGMYLVTVIDRDSHRYTTGKLQKE